MAYQPISAPTGGVNAGLESLTDSVRGIAAWRRQRDQDRAEALRQKFYMDQAQGQAARQGAMDVQARQESERERVAKAMALYKTHMAADEPVLARAALANAGLSINEEGNLEDAPGGGAAPVATPVVMPAAKPPEAPNMAKPAATDVPDFDESAPTPEGERPSARAPGGIEPVLDPDDPDAVRSGGLRPGEQFITRGDESSPTPEGFRPSAPMAQPPPPPEPATPDARRALALREVFRSDTRSPADAPMPLTPAQLDQQRSRKLRLRGEFTDLTIDPDEIQAAREAGYKRAGSLGESLGPEAMARIEKYVRAGGNIKDAYAIEQDRWEKTEGERQRLAQEGRDEERWKRENAITSGQLDRRAAMAARAAAIRPLMAPPSEGERKASATAENLRSLVSEVDAMPGLSPAGTKTIFEHTRDQEMWEKNPTLAAGAARVGANKPIGEKLSPEDFAAYSQYEEIGTLILRKESGAAISNSEWAGLFRRYFPQPGDTEEIKKRKRTNLEARIKSMESEGGRATTQAAAKSTPPTKPDATKSAPPKSPALDPNFDARFQAAKQRAGMK